MVWRRQTNNNHGANAAGSPALTEQSSMKCLLTQQWITKNQVAMGLSQQQSAAIMAAFADQKYASCQG